jgi:hypothetical protein
MKWTCSGSDRAALDSVDEIGESVREIRAMRVKVRVAVRRARMEIIRTSKKNGRVGREFVAVGGFMMPILTSPRGRDDYILGSPYRCFAKSRSHGH